MDKKIKLSVISKYRSQLMGIAAIFILLCHTKLKFTEGGTLYSLNRVFIYYIMQFGVDIFLILSGLGCFYSLKKQPSVPRFYLKRFIRIVPTFLIVVALFGIADCAFFGKNVGEYVYDYSAVTFFTAGKLPVWFVAVILALYLVFPLFYKFVNASSVAFACSALVFAAITLLPFWRELPAPLPVIREIFFTRVPSFMFGILVAERINRKPDSALSAGHIVCAAAVFIGVGALCAFTARREPDEVWTYLRLMFLPLSFSFMILVSAFFEKTHIERRPANRIWLFFGSISFEIYLIFEHTLSVLNKLLPQTLFPSMRISYYSMIKNAAAAVVTVILAFVIHKAVALFTKRKKQS